MSLLHEHYKRSEMGALCGRLRQRIPFLPEELPICKDSILRGRSGEALIPGWSEFKGGVDSRISFKHAGAQLHLRKGPDPALERGENGDLEESREGNVSG